MKGTVRIHLTSLQRTNTGVCTNTIHLMIFYVHFKCNSRSRRGRVYKRKCCLSASLSVHHHFFLLQIFSSFSLTGGDLLRSVLRMKMKSNSSSRKIVTVSANNNRFRVTFHGTIQPFTSLDSTDILKSFEIFFVTFKESSVSQSVSSILSVFCF